MSVVSYRYCGRNFTAEELKIIEKIIKTPDHPARAEISRRVCREIGWYRPNGQLKDMSCRVALLRMQRDGLISLPLPRNGNGNGNIRIKLSGHSDPPGSELRGRVDNYRFDIQIVESTEQSRLWNEYIARYHYLGYTPLPGAQIRYMVRMDLRSRRCLDLEQRRGKWHLATVGSAGRRLSVNAACRSSQTTVAFSFYHGFR